MADNYDAIVDERELPPAYERLVDTFRCPLTGDIMVDPVIVSGSGVSYERTAITAFLRTSNRDPVTGDNLNADGRRLISNIGFIDIIRDTMLYVSNRFAPVHAQETRFQEIRVGPMEDH
jgi:hypothetical protein